MHKPQPLGAFVCLPKFLATHTKNAQQYRALNSLHETASPTALYNTVESHLSETPQIMIFIDMLLYIIIKWKVLCFVYKIFHLLEHFSYPNTPWFQCVWMSDFLLYSHLTKSTSYIAIALLFKLVILTVLYSTSPLWTQALAWLLVPRLVEDLPTAANHFRKVHGAHTSELFLQH